MRLVHFPLQLIAQPLRLVTSLLSIPNRAFNIVLALLQAFQNWAPGVFLENHKEDYKNNDAPDA